MMMIRGKEKPIHWFVCQQLTRNFGVLYRVTGKPCFSPFFPVFPPFLSFKLSNNLSSSIEINCQNKIKITWLTQLRFNQQIKCHLDDKHLITKLYPQLKLQLMKWCWRDAKFKIICTLNVFPYWNDVFFLDQTHQYINCNCNLV